MIRFTLHRKIWNWLTLPIRSWTVHGVVSIIISIVFAILGGLISQAALGWAIGALLACVFYCRKEWLDYVKYRDSGAWDKQQREDSSITNKQDGAGDLLASVFLAIGSVVAYILGVL